MAIRIWSHKPGSTSAAYLSGCLEARVLQAPERTTWVPSSGDVVVNWGNSQLNGRLRQESLDGVHMLNPPAMVRTWSDKRSAFNSVTGFVQPVPNTTDKNDALTWLQGGNTIVVRHKVRSSSGDGIQIVEPGEVLPDAPLYTCYVKKGGEYRVHFVRHPNTMAFFWQKKLRQMDVENPDWKVRNYENGFIYSPCRNNDEKPSGWSLFENQVSRMCDLDYGAIDLLFAMRDTNPVWIIQDGRLKFLELNTAPGISSPSLREFYRQQLGERVRHEQQQ